MVMVPSIVSSFPKMKDVTMSMFFLAANLYPEVPSKRKLKNLLRSTKSNASPRLTKSQ